MKFNPEIGFLSRVSEEDKILFAKHLAVMAKSGISLAESIEVLIRQTKTSAFKRVLQGVLGDLENGQQLSKALSRYPKIFDPFYVNLIEIGEDSGNLSKNLMYLADQLEKNHAFQSKIKSALFYPAIVLSLAFVVGMGVSIFALPQLITIFESFDVPLPWNTQVLIFIATVMRDYGIAIFIAVIALFVGFRLFIRIPRIRLIWHRFLLKMPLVGPLVENTQLTLLCRNLGVMIQGGIPISSALGIQERNTDNLVYRGYVAGIRAAVNTGKTIASQFFLQEYKAIPPIVGKMVDVGEKSGKLDESLIYLGDFFESSVDNLTKNISVIIEPVLLFVIASIVAFVALSIITPIYQLTGSITPTS
jgi:type IV pilus assembly protein PilC